MLQSSRSPRWPAASTRVACALSHLPIETELQTSQKARGPSELSPSLMAGLQRWWLSSSACVATPRFHSLGLDGGNAGLRVLEEGRAGHRLWVPVTPLSGLR